ncbi:type I restriction endonuclease subunit R [Aliarcobacter butzleri]|uniref:type I restriction endonuclease subunit R n=1 Tax=Aliarcobacter butzleri TaxID=28197 RepID=UPI002B2525BC|nr:type I restriction endonuclease subunit R [Aliarcobacter butzleri]
MSYEYNEDNLVEQATVDVLESLDWTITTAWKQETFGDDKTLGRDDKSQVILKKFLIPKLKEFNPNLPEQVYMDAYLQIAQKVADKTLDRINKEKYLLLKNGVEVSYQNDKGELEKKKLKIFDFKNPTENDFLAVRQFEVLGELYLRRPDVIGFVNGIPLVFFELKAHHRDLFHAYDDNLRDYKNTIPHLFNTNAFIILSNGLDKSDDSGTKLGTVTSPYKFFHEWKRIEENEEGIVSLDTTIRGTCDKTRLMDIFENFLIFNDDGGDVVKIMAKNHQFIGVNKTLNNAQNFEELKGKLGVFWHTQGSGKSYSMVFLSQKIHRKFSGSYTVLVVVDRSELESQIYDTFTAIGAVKADEKVVASSRDHLRELLKQNHKYIFTLIHKFSIDPKKESEYPLLSERSDIIVISDEAHRTQGGVFARNMRFNALPNASYLGFTGTPIIKGEEELTKNIFGEYVSVYDFKSAIDDGATLPLSYINKGEKLKLENEKIDDEMAEILENENLTDDQKRKLDRLFSTNYPVLTAEKRLRTIAKDLVWHFNERGYQGKGMLVALDKPTALRMYNFIEEYWQDYLVDLENRINAAIDEQEELELKKKKELVSKTEVCVIVSGEQNEEEKFKKLGLDIKPHRKKMVDRDLEKEFKDVNNPFRLVIVCAMWITGFDAPSISTVYLDKPIKGHTLMQTIARANRVYDDEKENGLIVDYGNVYQKLEEAYSIYGEGGKGGSSGGNGTGGEVGPTKTLAELALELEATINEIIESLKELGFDLDNLIEAKPIEKLALIKDAINAVCLNETTRAKFEVHSRDMFKKYKALYPEEEVKPYIKRYNAIEAIYNGLNQKVKEADISDVILQLQGVVDGNIEIINDPNKNDVYIDLSRLDFDKLKQAFSKVQSKNKMVYDLQQAIDKKLKRMLADNPLRLEYYEKYLKIIDEYNKGKDAEATKKAFEDLIDFLDGLNEEDTRAVKEGLDEETLAIFDLLKKETLSKEELDVVKKVAKETLGKLKAEKLKVMRWRESEQLKAQVRTTIHDQLLWLPQESYSDDEVETKTVDVYQHIYSSYYGGGESIYNSFVA